MFAAHMYIVPLSGKTHLKNQNPTLSTLCCVRFRE